ncbi:MAG: dihydrolipoyl dehydrogenase [Rikenellaceae bacterium]|nr:dihydrolipoyl dehydrogenase [Rikenellaceae bacterium]
MNKFDLAIIGSGPGGYVAAIRASQLGKRTVIIERAELGGVCLNWGCIPTKALLRSAHLYENIAGAAQFGIDINGSVTADFAKVVQRSRDVSATMSKGVQFLLSKNKVETIQGEGRLKGQGVIEISHPDGTTDTIQAEHIILATGSRPRQLPTIPIDGDKVISYREALTLSHMPSSMVVIGSGAIGSELADFYHTMGCKVTVVEYMPTLVPTEDEEVSKYLERSFRKKRLPFLTGATVEKVESNTNGCLVTVSMAKGTQTIEAGKVLSAAGVTPNTENIGLENVGLTTERGKIKVDKYYRTDAPGIYAIGDIIPTPALAHVASAEAVCCVEAICGLNPEPVDYNVIPACIYTSPEIASVGMRERDAVAQGIETRIGKFPYTASGKATAMGDKDGFVKLIFDKASDKLIGAHFIGATVTEMLMEPTLAMRLGATAKQILSTVHPHPTLAEAVMEAAGAAHQEAIHI